MTLKDFTKYDTGLTAPAESWPVATPSDSTEYTNPPRAIVVTGSAGTVVMQDKLGNTMTLTVGVEGLNVERAYRPFKIMAASTATGIHLLY